MIALPTLADVASDPQRVRTLPPEAAVSFAFEFSRLSALCFITAMHQRPVEDLPAPVGPEVLRPMEAARLVNMSYKTFKAGLGQNPDLRVDVGTKRPRYSKTKLLTYVRRGAASDGSGAAIASADPAQGWTPGRRPSLRQTRRTLRRGE